MLIIMKAKYVKCSVQFPLRGSTLNDCSVSRIKALFSFVIGVFFAGFMLFALIDTASAVVVKPGESIQSAINSLPAEGGIVELAAGTHNITESVFINRPDLTLTGVGSSSIINMTAINKSSIIINMDYNTSNWAGAAPPLVVMNTTIQNMKVYGYRDSGASLFENCIAGRNAVNVTIQNVDLSYCNRAIIMGGTEVQSNQTDTKIAGNWYIYNNTVHDTADGFYFQNSNIGVFSKNTITDGGYGYGVSLNSRNSNWTVLNNTIANSSNNGILVYSGSNNNVVSNNMISNSNDEGIKIFQSSNNTIQNNTINGGTMYGIHERDNSHFTYDNKIINNIVSNTKTYGGLGHGIGIDNEYAESYPQNTLVVSNTVYNNSIDGIYIGTQMLNIIIKNNIIVNNKGYGINTKTSSIISSYNDVYNNALGNYKGTSPGTGNISADPLFANPAGDFHLKSQAGRWNGTAWINDPATSPAIDAGDPSSDYSKEPMPNGGRVNAGAYGNTPEASKSISGPTIISYFPEDPSPAQNNGSTYQFNVSTNQLMTTNVWLLDGNAIATGSQKYNITALGSRGRESPTALAWG